MAIAFRSSANTTYATRTNTTVTAPAGIQDGDWLLFFLFEYGAPPATPTPPAGFNALTGSPSVNTSGASDFNLYAWAKLASGEAGNYTATHSSNPSQGAILCYSGGANPAITVTPTKNNSAGTTTTCTGLTTTAAGSMLVAAGCDNGDTANNLTPPTGMNERVDVAPLMYIADVVQAGAGASGNKTFTNNSNAGGPWVSWLVCFDPAPEPPTGVPIWLVTA